jgi:O-antigen/teichoic acid export membrane protein
MVQRHDDPGAGAQGCVGAAQPMSTAAGAITTVIPAEPLFGNPTPDLLLAGDGTEDDDVQRAGGSTLVAEADAPARPGPRARPANRVARNLVSLLLSQIATWGISAALIVVIPHFLTASDLGALQFSATFVGYFGLVGALGTGTFLVKAVARDQSLLGPYVFNALVLKIVSAVGLAAIAIGLAHALGFPGRTELLIEVACLAMAFSLLADVLRAGLQGIERMGRPAIWGVVQGYVATGAGLVVLVRGRGVVLYAFVIAAAGVIPVVANVGHLARWLRQSLHIDLGVWREIIVGGFPFLLWSSVLVLYGTIDIPILEAMAGNATVGWYSVAYAWVTVPAGFSALVVTAVFPSLSASAHEARGEFIELANRAIRLVFFVGLPASAGMAVIAPDVFRLFHYQAGFGNSIPLIRILALHIPIVGMDMVLGTALIAIDKQRQWTMIGCLAAVFNPLVNLAAIPITMHLFHDGAIGASIITVATEALMMVGAIYLRPRGVLDRATASFMARCALATLTMVGAVAAMGGAPLPAKVAAGVLVYLVIAVATKAVSPRDLGSLGLAPSMVTPGGAKPPAFHRQRPAWRHRAAKRRRRTRGPYE